VSLEEVASTRRVHEAEHVILRGEVLGQPALRLRRYLRRSRVDDDLHVVEQVWKRNREFGMSLSPGELVGDQVPGRGVYGQVGPREPRHRHQHDETQSGHH
jgi:hypothetical protein